MTITIPTPLEVTAEMEGAEISIDLSYPVPVTVHADLTGRDAADSHPIAAITGLQAALDSEGDIALFKNITANYTLLAADNGYWINAEHATDPIAVTIPAGLTGQEPIIIQKQGAADISIDDSLVTVTGDLNIKTQYHIIVLVNKGGDLWTAIGGVS